VVTIQLTIMASLVTGFDYTLRLLSRKWIFMAFYIPYW